MWVFSSSMKLTLFLRMFYGSSRSSAVSDLQPWFLCCGWSVDVTSGNLTRSLTCCCASTLVDSLSSLRWMFVLCVLAIFIFEWMTDVEKLYNYFRIHEEQEHTCTFLHMSCVLQDLFWVWKLFMNFVFWYIIIWRCCWMKVRHLQTGTCHQLQPWS